MQNQYHIDVTPEEDLLFRDLQYKKHKFNNISFLKNKVFWLVLFFHLSIIIVVTYASSNEETFSTKTNKTFTGNITTSDAFKIRPTPESTPVVTEVPNDIKPKIMSTSDVKNPLPEKKNLTSYVVKKGDTIYSISKKYKLSIDKLIKINNIKDPNKITIGQKLIFL